MFPLLKKVLFSLPTETSHHLALSAMSGLERFGLARLVGEPMVRDEVEVMGIRFPNRVGLAAGLDKNADHIRGLAAAGFGFVEVGTVTPRPQSGNPRPRLFRLPEAEAIINRMGFNNFGVDHLVEAVQNSGFDGVLGINIGKNKDTPAENAVDDYLHCMRKVYPLASYITVNLSSPNTPGLRDLQFGEPLKQLVTTLKAEQAVLAESHGRYVPLAVKIAPDMADEDLAGVAEVLAEAGIDAVIATNTTIGREGVEHLHHGNEAGGLSGAPLTERSTEVIRKLAEILNGRMPIIGVGGIVDGDNAAEKIAAGAALVQIYSGFIYHGPELVKEAAESIAAL